jgi:chloramphenicol-sensitive protein RarD
MNDRPNDRSGLWLAVLAYVLWGFLPLYFRALHTVPPLELVGWRVVFTLPLCLLIIRWRGQVGEVRAAFANRRTLMQLCGSALLIGSNWLIYVLAIQHGHVLAASLGYYINPLINVVLGTALLGERLSRTQWVAVAIAASGTALLVAGALDMLGVAMALAVTFAGYGLVRKLTPVGAVPGLTVETTLLLLPGIAAVTWFAQSPEGSSLGKDATTTTLLVLAGGATAVPLLLFAVAARKLDLSVLGFVQFVSPTIAFVLGLTVFGEPLDTTRLACFMLIWLAIGIYSWDMFRRRAKYSRT